MTRNREGPPGAGFPLGSWLIEPSLNRISRPGAFVRLEPKVMELLVLLAESPNAVVSKDEITRRLWPGTFVTESSIFRHVSELRRALGDDRRRPRYVQTIPKKGYRLVVEAPPAPLGQSRLSPTLALVAVLAVLVGAVYWLGGRELRSRLGPLPSQPPVDEGAYYAYLRGELFENRVDCASFDRAIDSYSEAMHRDRALSDAYPKLFDALVATAVLGCRPPQPLFAELESLLDVAERSGLDESRKEQGQAALALWRDGDAALALAAFRSAGKKAPSNASEDLSYAVAFVVSGRAQEGIREARLCLEALPTDLGENWALGGILYLTGHYEEAIEQLLATLELYPGYRPALQLLALSYLMAGEREQALAVAARAEPPSEERWNRFDAVPGYVYAATGNAGRARQILAQWVERSETEWVPKSSLALLHLGLGEPEEARRWLERGREEQDPWVLLVPVDPAFRALTGGSREATLRVP